jgi:predicted  nucleic acid-binding Zn-ribbon protein
MNDIDAIEARLEQIKGYIVHTDQELADIKETILSNQIEYGNLTYQLSKLKTEQRELEDRIAWWQEQKILQAVAGHVDW